MDLVTVLGLTASMVQLIDATTKVISFLNNVNDAPKDRAKLAIELTSLLPLLVSLRYRVGDAQTTDPWLGGIRSLGVENGPLDQFRRAMEELAIKLDPGTKMKALARRVLWKFKKEEINEALFKIERLKTICSLALQNNCIELTRAMKGNLISLIDEVQVLEGGVARLELGRKNQESHARDERRHEVITWLSSLDYRSKQNDIFTRRQEGTGEWILEAEGFKAWLYGMIKTLWCPGIPGAGKTVLTSVVVNHLAYRFQEGNVCVAYVYFNYKEQNQTAINLIASLLQQFAIQQPTISQDVANLHKAHTQNWTRPTLIQYSQLLRSEALRFLRIFIVVDAFDECVESEGRAFLEEIMKLPTHVSLMVTSRHIASIERALEQSFQLEIRAKDRDIKTYFEARMECHHLLTSITNPPSALNSDILDTVVGRSNGLDMRRALQHLPEELDETYDRVMERILCQEPQKVKRAKQVLSWIFYAVRPLTIEELQCTLAVEPDDKDLDVESLIDKDTLTSVCAGLVSFDRESHAIRLVHYTAQSYFERTRAQYFPAAETSIATTCLIYLSFKRFTVQSSAVRANIRSCLEQNALLGYAAHNWGTHVRGEVEPTAKDMITEFLMDESKTYVSGHVLFRFKYRYSHSYSQQMLHKVSGLHIAAYLGLGYAVEALLQKDVLIDIEDADGRTPLLWAVENGHAAIVDLLLDKGADVGAYDKGCRTALHLAAISGHEAVISSLVSKGADAAARDITGNTAMTIESRLGHNNISKYVVAHTTNLQSVLRGNLRLTSKTETECSTVRQDLQMTEGQNKAILVEHGGEQSSIFNEAKKSNLEAVRILIEHGTDVQMKLPNGETPLSVAEAAGQNTIVQLMLTDVWFQSRTRRTPLHQAASNGRSQVVKVLLDNGALIDSKDNHLNTPLHLATIAGHIDTIQVLLNRGANIAAKTDQGHNVLHLAAIKGDETAVALFLNDGAEVIAIDKHNATALHWAYLFNCNSIIKLLQPNETPIPQSVELPGFDNNGSGEELAIIDSKTFDSIVEMDEDDEGSDLPFSRGISQFSEQTNELSGKLKEKFASNDEDQFRQLCIYIMECCATVGALRPKRSYQIIESYYQLRARSGLRSCPDHRMPRQGIKQTLERAELELAEAERTFDKLIRLRHLRTRIDNGMPMF